MTPLRRLVFAVACVLLSAAGPALAIDRGELKKALVANMKVARNDQRVVFGPLKDGRTFQFLVRYVSDDNWISISPADGSAGPDGRRFYIDYGRPLLIRSVFILDATMACYADPVVACPLMNSYSDTVRTADIMSVPFVEERFIAAKPSIEKSTANAQLYVTSLLAGIESTIVVTNLHEMGHAILGHQPETGPARRRQEAEADGFAAKVLDVAGMSAASGPAAIMASAPVTNDPGNDIDGEPPAICRIAAFQRQSIEWIKSHEAELSAPSGNAGLDALSNKITQDLTGAGQSLALSAESLSQCKDYFAHYLDGYRKAGELVAANTNLDAEVPEQPNR